MEKRRKRDSGGLGGGPSLMGDMRSFVGGHPGAPGGLPGAGAPPSLTGAGLGGPGGLLGSSLHDWPVSMMSSSSYLSSHAAGYHHHSPGSSSAASAYLPHSSTHNPHHSSSSSSSYLPPYSASYHPSYHSSNMISDPHQGILPDLQVPIDILCLTSMLFSVDHFERLTKALYGQMIEVCVDDIFERLIDFFPLS